MITLSVISCGFSFFLVNLPHLVTNMTNLATVYLIDRNHDLYTTHVQKFRIFQPPQPSQYLFQMRVVSLATQEISHMLSRHSQARREPLGHARNLVFSQIFTLAYSSPPKIFLSLSHSISGGTIKFKKDVKNSKNVQTI